ncbi:formate dehydrogenase accessory sulfurtransferase FdhD [Runella slithyformis]|uniref:Sulfur carrier protein FdhD n=1 Tax=Runella slithyformis (strain ATCC 29530 / DSM 19594 / LMG 11500 / NCIMB 11436 / LSU 4) TaxID=761193 RepID=A0A7U3ZPX8_RUNSL|nr:formate dehydrogenase accessory sulfurtransferase FdhD [Runella slithyformis]AEI51158.1 Protein fdhD [Runella slithyformis DSM 19594]
MSTKDVMIWRYNRAGTHYVADTVVMEEPLEIRIRFKDNAEKWVERPLSITMRTPGDDPELAIGFLFTEGMLRPEQLDKVTMGLENTVTVHVKPDTNPELEKMQRNFYATSSCGVCGKSSLDALGYTYGNLHFAEELPPLSPELITSLPQALTDRQTIFDETGGIHAAGLFDWEANLILAAEDVGRHNAVDKIAGKALRNQQASLDRHILVLSGRACFELLHKALALNIPVVVAVGAPSSLAIETAERFGQTLIGFTREGRFNVYSGMNRIHSSHLSKI